MTCIFGQLKKKRKGRAGGKSDFSFLFSHSPLLKWNLDMHPFQNCK